MLMKWKIEIFDAVPLNIKSYNLLLRESFLTSFLTILLLDLRKKIWNSLIYTLLIFLNRTFSNFTYRLKLVLEELKIFFQKYCLLLSLCFLIKNYVKYVKNAESEPIDISITCGYWKTQHIFNAIHSLLLFIHIIRSWYVFS